MVEESNNPDSAALAGAHDDGIPVLGTDDNCPAVAADVMLVSGKDAGFDPYDTASLFVQSAVCKPKQDC